MKSQNKMLVSLSVICIMSVICMALVLSFPTRFADFTPPPFDAAAEKGAPAVPEGLGYQVLDAQLFHAGVCGEITVADAAAYIWLTNPESNSVWLKLRIIDMSGNILGETGLLTPGQYVQSVTLNTVPEPGTPVVLKIMAYEPETYYSAGSVSINTTIQ